MDRFGALTGAALDVTAVFAAGRVFAAVFAFGRGAGLDALAAGRLRRTGRFLARAWGAGFRAFLADFAATRRLGAVRFRPAAFFDAARVRPAAFRAPVFFLPACPGRRRRARVAFRLAMGRPFRFRLR